MFTVREAITDIYRKMGNLSKSQVDLLVVLSRLYSVINRRLTQLNLSTNNWILSYVDLEDSGEFRNVLPTTDFANVVAIEHIGWDDEEGHGIPIEVINPINAANAVADNKRAIGFYIDSGTGDWNYVTTFKNYEGTLRVWYEPNLAVPAGIEQNINIKNIFKDLITSETAYFMMDYVNSSMPVEKAGRIKLSLREDFMLWDDEWKEELQKGRQLKSVVRTPFRAGM